MVFLAGLSRNSQPAPDYPFRQSSDLKVDLALEFRMTLKPNYSEQSRPLELNSSKRTAEGLGFDFERRESGNSAILLNLQQQLARLAHQVGDLSTLGDGFPGVEPMLHRIFVAARSPRSRCAAMHPATLLSLNGGRSAWLAGTGSGAAARARNHRSSITQKTRRRHFLFGRVAGMGAAVSTL